MKKVFSLLRLDFLETVRNSLYWSLLITAIVAIIFIDFVIPAKLNLVPESLFYDGSSGKIMEQYLVNSGVDTKDIISSKEKLIEDVKKGSSQMGLIFEGSIENPKFTLVYSDTVSKNNVRLVEASINKFIQMLRNNVQNNTFQIKFLRAKGKPIPLNKNTIPIFIVLEVIILGFMLVSIMMFQEKQEGTVLAYRVTPSGTLTYITSKSLLFLVSSLIYGGIIILFTMGVKVNFIYLFLIISLSSLLMTLVGLFVGIFFNDISGWFPWGILILVINTVPIISYVNPTFSPLWVKAIPSYYVLFSVREILFSTGKSGFIVPVLSMLTLECIVMFLISFWGVKKKLMEAGSYNV